MEVAYYWLGRFLRAPFRHLHTLICCAYATNRLTEVVSLRPKQVGALTSRQANWAGAFASGLDGADTPIAHTRLNFRQSRGARADPNDGSSASLAVTTCLILVSGVRKLS